MARTDRWGSCGIFPKWHPSVAAPPWDGGYPTGALHPAWLHLYEEDAWQFVLLKLMGSVKIAVVSHDVPVIVPTAACDFMRPFVDIVFLFVKYPSEMEGDEFLHREIKDLASVVS